MTTEFHLYHVVGFTQTFVGSYDCVGSAQKAAQTYIGAKRALYWRTRDRDRDLYGYMNHNAKGALFDFRIIASVNHPA